MPDERCLKCRLPLGEAARRKAFSALPHTPKVAWTCNACGLHCWGERLPRALQGLQGRFALTEDPENHRGLAICVDRSAGKVQIHVWEAHYARRTVATMSLTAFRAVIEILDEKTA